MIKISRWPQQLQVSYVHPPITAEDTLTLRSENNQNNHGIRKNGKAKSVITKLNKKINSQENSLREEAEGQKDVLKHGRLHSFWGSGVSVSEKEAQLVACLHISVASIQGKIQGKIVVHLDLHLSRIGRVAFRNADQHGTGLGDLLRAPIGGSREVCSQYSFYVCVG